MICNDNAPIQAWLNTRTGACMLRPAAPSHVPECAEEILLGGIAADELLLLDDIGLRIRTSRLAPAAAVVCAQEGAFGLTWVRNPAMSTLGDRPCPPIPPKWVAPESAAAK